MSTLIPGQAFRFAGSYTRTGICYLIIGRLLCYEYPVWLYHGPRLSTLQGSGSHWGAASSRVPRPNVPDILTDKLAPIILVSLSVPAGQGG
jgi:hypothetical protein